MNSNRKSLIFLLCLFIISLSLINSKENKKKKKRRKFERDHSVIIMNDANFDKIINSMDIFVFYYKTGCSPCVQFNKDFTAASLFLKGRKPPMNFGKINLEKETGVMKKYNISQFPFAHYFKKGKPYNYTGTLDSTGMIKFMWKSSLPPVSVLETTAEISQFKNSHEVTVIYFGNNKDIIRNIYDYAVEDSEIFYARTDFEMAYKTYGVKKDTVILYKNNGEDRTEISGKLTKTGIIDFINKNSYDLILKPNDRTCKLIWGYGEAGLFLFINHNDVEKTKSLTKTFKEASEKLVGIIRVIITGIETPEEQKLNSMAGVYPQELPNIRIIDPKKGRNNYYPYNPREEVTVENILKFVDNVRRNRIKLQKYSEPIPLSQRSLLYDIVGITFEKEIFFNHFHVIVLFYDSRTVFQSALDEMEIITTKIKNKEIIIYSEIEKMKNGTIPEKPIEINWRLKFGKFDMARNDPEMNLDLGNLPSIQLFYDDDKNKPFPYHGEIKLEPVVEFIRNMLKKKDKNEEQKKGEKENEEL